MELKKFEVGTWGGKGGSSWDDGIFTGVREIKLLDIDSILVVYDKEGENLSMEKDMEDLEALLLLCPGPLLQEEVPGWVERSIVVGPWGGNGGSNWDDGIFKGRRGLLLSVALPQVLDSHFISLFTTPKSNEINEPELAIPEHRPKTNKSILLIYSVCTQ
ncbi:hypothetical protein VNO77_29239 [Canavalia gladiata]|uniref:Jacalin-type lectin domain-containing protein n=1 Tax=Canavalia gladiata TaxID=3824 RepID=A0AAN9KWX6_CANGL